MPRKTEANQSNNDNWTTENVFTLDQLAQASGLDKDTLLQRLASTLASRDEDGLSITLSKLSAE